MHDRIGKQHRARSVILWQCLGVVSLAEVAKLAGVGVGTASRALTGKGSVDEATRARVVEAASRLGYRGNAAARALRERRSRVVGLLLPDLNNEFYTASAEVLQSELAEAGFQLIVAQTSVRRNDEQMAWDRMLRWQVEGVVHVPVDPEAPVPQDIPVVQLNRRSRESTIPAVLSDDVEGIGLLTEHLITMGHRDIGVITGQANFSTTQERVEGFHRAWARLNGPDVAANAGRVRARARVENTELSVEGGVKAFAAFEADLPTAILALNSRILLGVLSRCQELGLRVPEDISVAAIGDPAWYAVWPPGITTFSPPLAEMGRRASHEIISLIEKTESGSEPQVTRLAGEVILRSSVAPPSRSRA